MSLVSSLKHSIFVRIYAGLLIVCLCVALFAQLLMETINKERVQSYRENMATGAFHLVSEGILHQDNAEQRTYWLSDASSLFGTKFSIVPINATDFNASDCGVLKMAKRSFVISINRYMLTSIIGYQTIKAF